MFNRGFLGMTMLAAQIAVVGTHAAEVGTALEGCAFHPDHTGQGNKVRLLKRWKDLRPGLVTAIAGINTFEPNHGQLKRSFRDQIFIDAPNGQTYLVPSTYVETGTRVCHRNLSPIEEPQAQSYNVVIDSFNQVLGSQTQVGQILNPDNRMINRNPAGESTIPSVDPRIQEELNKLRALQNSTIGL